MLRKHIQSSLEVHGAPDLLSVFDLYSVLKISISGYQIIKNIFMHSLHGCMRLHFLEIVIRAQQDFYFNFMQFINFSILDLGNVCHLYHCLLAWFGGVFISTVNIYLYVRGRKFMLQCCSTKTEFFKFAIYFLNPLKYFLKFIMLIRISTIKIILYISQLIWIENNLNFDYILFNKF